MRSLSYKRRYSRGYQYRKEMMGVLAGAAIFSVVKSAILVGLDLGYNFKTMDSDVKIMTYIYIGLSGLTLTFAFLKLIGFKVFTYMFILYSIMALYGLALAIVVLQYEVIDNINDDTIRQYNGIMGAGITGFIIYIISLIIYGITLG